MKQTSHASKVGDTVKSVKPESVGLRIRPRCVTIKGQRYDYWSLDLGLVDGKRKVRTFKTKADAEREAERITKQGKRIGNDARRLSESELRDAAEALGLLERKRSLVEVARFYLRHGAGEGGEITVADLFSRFMVEKEGRNLAPKTLIDLRNRLAKFVSAHGSTKAHQVTTGDVEDYLTQFKGVVHRDNHRRCVANLFSYAMRRRYVQSNVVEAIEPPKKSHTPPMVLTPDEARAIMRAAETAAPDMVPYFALALFAGLRPESEIMRMDWSRINFEERIVDVPGAYSKIRTHRRNVPMEANLLRWLAPHRKNAGPINYRQADYLKVREVAQLAKGSSRWAIDIMRHSYASYHHEHFRDLAATAKNMGDNPRTVEARYVNIVKPSAAAAYWAIEPDKADVIQFKTA